ncbi:hypothetical protein [Kineococcus sp. SYSU DK005]|uniref:hypothetical protein n=1 Tax=Kineococcus sp. SYSU DK005 TaxID=3383126 RepID=UPI003D7CD131
MSKGKHRHATSVPSRSLTLGLLSAAAAVAGWSAIAFSGRWPYWVLALSATACTTFHFSAWQVHSRRAGGGAGGAGGAGGVER